MSPQVPVCTHALERGTVQFRLQCKSFLNRFITAVPILTRQHEKQIRDSDCISDCLLQQTVTLRLQSTVTSESFSRHFVSINLVSALKWLFKEHLQSFMIQHWLVYCYVGSGAQRLPRPKISHGLNLASLPYVASATFPLAEGSFLQANQWERSYVGGSSMFTNAPSSRVRVSKSIVCYVHSMYILTYNITYRHALILWKLGCPSTLRINLTACHYQ